MLKHCLACAREFPANNELEWLPIGRRVAFDARRGRLWVICRWCGHWSLLPIERRWEAVEELERRAHHGPSVLGATEQVSLLAMGAVEALRVGPAPAREEAWWRYGKALRGRRLRYDALTRAGGAVAAAGAVVGLAGFGLVMPDVALLKWRSIRSAPGRARTAGADAAVSFERWFRYGREVWRGSAACQSCGHRLERLLFSDTGTMLLEPDGSIRVRCQRCRGRDGWHVIGPHAAEQIVRRTLAWENTAGADDRQLHAAIQLIRSGQLQQTESLSLHRSSRETLIALELQVAHSYEARLLGWELAELERRWIREEGMAHIIDRELTPGPPAQ